MWKGRLEGNGELIRSRKVKSPPVQDEDDARPKRATENKAQAARTKREACPSAGTKGNARPKPIDCTRSISAPRFLPADHPHEGTEVEGAITSLIRAHVGSFLRSTDAKGVRKKRIKAQREGIKAKSIPRHATPKLRTKP